MTINRIRLVPNLAGILLIIGLLTPAIGVDLLGVGMHVWIWGLAYIYAPGNQFTGMTDNPSLIGLSIICTFMVFISIIMYFYSAKKMKEHDVGVGRLTGYGSCILFLALIIYIGGVTVILDPGGGASVWDVMGPGAQIILSFFALIIGIIGGYLYVNDYYRNRSSSSSPRKQITNGDLWSGKSSLPQKSTMESPRACSLCGNKLDDNADSCVKCGARVIKLPSINQSLGEGNFCSSCGKKYEQDIVFCPQCGEKIK